MHTYIKFHAASKFGKLSDRGQHLLNPTQAELDDAIAVGERDGFDTLLRRLFGQTWVDTLTRDRVAWDEAARAIWDELCSYCGVEEAYPSPRRLTDVLCRSRTDIDWRLKGQIKALYLTKRIGSALARHAAAERVRLQAAEA